MSLQVYKDIFYFAGSVSGIISFILTIKKREKCEFNYRTEFGNEIQPFLVCIKGDIFNLNIHNEKESIFVHKYPSQTNLSRIKYKDFDDSLIDKSSYFPVLKEGEILSLNNEDLKMLRIYLKYEDQYRNRYSQTFEFHNPDIRDNDRSMRKSRSCYVLSKRKFRFLWIWF